MSRPMKDGVDYWPRDVGLREDKKVRLIKGEFGIKGVYIYEEILNTIYREGGYYKKWDDDDCFLMSEGVGDGCTPNLIAEVVRGCLKRSLFDEGVFQAFGVLTSKGIQRRFIQAVYKNREEIPIAKEYWLLEKREVPAGTLNKIAFFEVSRTENPVKSTENPVKSADNAQRKEKKSKVNYKVIADLFNETCVSFPRCSKLSEGRKAAIRARFSAGYTMEDFQHLFQKAQESTFLRGGNKRNWTATFDWLISDSNMAKVLDGNYDDRQKGSRGKGFPETSLSSFGGSREKDVSGGSFDTDDFFEAALHRSYEESKE